MPLYLSKLFQFLFLPIQIRYEIDFADEVALRERLEGILDRIPDDVLPHLYQWKWWVFYYNDTITLKLDELFDVLSERLQEFRDHARRETFVMKNERSEVAPSSRVRRRRSETEERDAIIVSYLRRQMEDRAGLCTILDRNGIPTTPKMRAHGLDTWRAAWEDPEFRNNVQQVFSKALRKAEAVNS